MEALVVVLLALLLLAAAVSHLTVFPALWIGLRDQWRRTPAEARPRALISGAVGLILLVATMVVAVAQPWGERSVFYVILVAGGVTMLVVMSIVMVEVARRIRRSRR